MTAVRLSSPPAATAQPGGHDGKLRLGFVVCPAFHGATLLALLLNNHSHVSALGDTNPSRDYDQMCACRQHVSECDFWQTVAKRTRADRFARLDTLLPILPRPLAKYRIEGRALPITSNPTLDRRLGAIAAAALDVALPFVWRVRPGVVREYVETWHSAYSTVSGLHGTSVVFDGSKSARKVALIARELRDLAEVRVVHLVRDPRGFVASWRRHNGADDVRALSWLWSDLHARMEDLGEAMPYRRVRYEDLAAHPEKEMASLLEFLQLPAEAVVGPPKYPAKHHLMGNEMLFSFDGRIARDERWRTELERADQAAVLRHAGAVGTRFGYA